MLTGEKCSFYNPQGFLSAEPLMIFQKDGKSIFSKLFGLTDEFLWLL